MTEAGTSSRKSVIDAKSFFGQSDLVDQLAVRQLAHIRANWELTWDPDKDRYEDEEDSFASELNLLIEELSTTNPPARYHDNEDRLAEFTKTRLGWNIRKVGNRWVGGDYASILEQGAFQDVDQQELLFAAAGRIKAAIDRGQRHFDEMEESHQRMLADVLAVILYHRDRYRPA